MNYKVKRGDQEYGPYSLAELQQYLAKGDILPDDLARGEGTEQWVPVQQVVGNIPVSPASSTPVNYGQVPLYSSASFGAAPGASAADTPMPPGLHWGLVLLFTVVTCGLFAMVWAFVEAAFAQKLQTKSTPMLFYAIGWP